MRRHGRIDANQPAIVKGLRDVGCSVAITSALGNGYGDILVAIRLRTVWMEIKDPDQPPSKRELTPDEKAFRETWKGEIYTVETLEEAVGIMFRGTAQAGI